MILLTAMGTVLISWAIALLAITGVGLLIQRGFGGRADSAERLLWAFWLGWAGLLVFLQLWHGFLPVDARASAVLGLIGLLGLLWHRRDVARVIARPHHRKTWFLVVMLLLTLWIANRALDAPRNTDSGGYHIASVRWVTSYPVVPGIGNLYTRFAYNSSYFLYVGALEVGPWLHKPWHIANGLLLLVLLSGLVLAGCKLVDADRHPRRLEYLYAALFLAPTLVIGVDRNLTSPTPDLPLYLLGVVAMLMFLAVLRDTGDDPRAYTATVLSLLLITATGVVVKLSFVVMLLVMVLVMVPLWWRHVGVEHRRALLRPALLGMLAIGALLLLPWMARSVVLSGYPLFPSPLFGLPVEWRLPPDVPRLESLWVRAWAYKPFITDPEPVVRSWAWFGPWCKRMCSETRPLFLFVLPMLLSLALLAPFVRQVLAGLPKPDRRIWWLFAPLVATVIFWFCTGPEPRFAGSAFWAIGLGIAVIVLQRWNISGRTLVRGGAVWVIAMLLLPAWKYGLLLPPGPDHGFYPMPKPVLSSYQTRSGLHVWYPLDGQIWDGPLPCTIQRCPNLRQRVPGDLRRGFYLDPPIFDYPSTLVVPAETR